MKEILVAFAAYNREANGALIEILSRQSEILLREEQGNFYKSILGTLEHIAIAEASWLRRFKGFFEYPSLAASPLLTAAPDDLEARIRGGFASIREVLLGLDALLLAFAGELEEGTLSQRVKFKNPRGEELERDYWNLVFHIFNHGTHHRGEISVLLDRKGVSNDYSGFNRYRT